MFCGPDEAFKEMVPVRPKCLDCKDGKNRYTYYHWFSGDWCYIDMCDSCERLKQSPGKYFLVSVGTKPR